MPSSSSETGAQNARVKIFHEYNFRGFYFRVSVVGSENRENLDLAKISRYTVPIPVYTPALHVASSVD